MHLSGALDAIQAGDRVRFVVHLINQGDETVTVPRSDDDSVEVSLRRNDAELWRWTVTINRGSAGGTTIPPGDRVRWFCEWPDPTYGTYTAIATVLVDDTTVTAESPVTVTKGVAEAATATPDDRTPRTGGPHGGDGGIEPERPAEDDRD